MVGIDKSIARITVWLIIPFGLLVLAGVATRSCRQEIDAFDIRNFESGQTRPSAIKRNIDTHYKSWGIDKKLDELEIAGKDLFFEGHTWQIPDYDPKDDKLETFKRGLSPVWMAQWKKRIKTDNIDEAERVASNYNYVRLYYSHGRWTLNKLKSNVSSAVAELPSDARYDEVFRADWNYLDAGDAIGSIDRAFSIFATKIKPYFTP